MIQIKINAVGLDELGYLGAAGEPGDVRRKRDSVVTCPNIDRPSAEMIGADNQCLLARIPQSNGKRAAETI